MPGLHDDEPAVGVLADLRGVLQPREALCHVGAPGGLAADRPRHLVRRLAL